MSEVSIVMYSTKNSATFEVDLDDDNIDKPEDDCSSLFITHSRDFSESTVRHFLTVAQLRQLRDLLNEKLPDNRQRTQMVQTESEVRAAVADWEAGIKANPPQRVL